MNEGIERATPADPIEVVELEGPAAGTGDGFSGRIGRRPAVIRVAAVSAAAGALILSAALTMAASPTPSGSTGGGASPAVPASPGVTGPWGGGHGMMGPGWMLGGGWARGPGRGGMPALGAITITAIDGSSLSLKTADGWTRTIAVSSSTKITKGGQVASLADLKVGDQIRFQQTRNTDGTYSITAVEIVLPSVSGTVGALTSSGFTVKAPDGTTTNVIVTGSTAYQLGRGTGSKSDVKVGDRVAVEGTKGSDGSITASTVRIAPAMVAGTVTAKTATSLTVRLRGGTTTTVNVSSATTYRVAGKSPATLADIAVGMRIVAQGTTAADGSLQASTVAAGAAGNGKGWGMGGGPFMAPPVQNGAGQQG